MAELRPDVGLPEAPAAVRCACAGDSGRRVARRRPAVAGGNGRRIPGMRWKNWQRPQPVAQRRGRSGAGSNGRRAGGSGQASGVLPSGGDGSLEPVGFFLHGPGIVPYRVIVRHRAPFKRISGLICSRLPAWVAQHKTTCTIHIML